jgi:hypothetical protein
MARRIGMWIDDGQCSPADPRPCHACRHRADAWRGPIMFKTNVGGIDRVLRIVVGLVLIALVFIGPKTPWGWIGVIPIATGFLRTCPLYSLIGVNTCSRE